MQLRQAAGFASAPRPGLHLSAILCGRLAMPKNPFETVRSGNQTYRREADQEDRRQGGSANGRYGVFTFQSGTTRGGGFGFGGCPAGLFRGKFCRFTGPVGVLARAQRPTADGRSDYGNSSLDMDHTGRVAAEKPEKLQVPSARAEANPPPNMVGGWRPPNGGLRDSNILAAGHPIC